MFLLYSAKLIVSEDLFVKNWGITSFLVNIFFNVGSLTEATFIDQEINHVIMVTWALTLVFYMRVGKSSTDKLLSKIN